MGPSIWVILTRSDVSNTTDRAYKKPYWQHKHETLCDRLNAAKRCDRPTDTHTSHGHCAISLQRPPHPSRRAACRRWRQLRVATRAPWPSTDLRANRLSTREHKWWLCDARTQWHGGFGSARASGMSEVDLGRLGTCVGTPSVAADTCAAQVLQEVLAAMCVMMTVSRCTCQQRRRCGGGE